MKENETRMERGLELLNKLDENLVADKIKMLGDLGNHVIQFAYGDIMSRDTLSLREREMIVIGMLTALGGREQQLKVHMKGALQIGVTPKELEEVILQTVPYAGFPTAINAMHVLLELKAEQEAE